MVYENWEESRKRRTTTVLYTESYWEELWRKRFNVGYSMNDPQVIIENEKKLTFIQNLFHRTGGRTLDVGCSFGYFVSFMRTRGWDAHGIDCSEYALSKAEEDTKRFLTRGVATSLPYEDRSFDVVTCFDVLEHLYIEEILAAVEEVKRVCRDAILIKLPASGFLGEQGIADASPFTMDKGHISVYPWEFWARRFHGNDFQFLNASLWSGDGGQGLCTEAWIGFRRRT